MRYGQKISNVFHNPRQPPKPAQAPVIPYKRPFFMTKNLSIFIKVLYIKINKKFNLYRVISIFRKVIVINSIFYYILLIQV
jgi:hypothetical protein